MNEPNTILITPSGDIRKINKERKVIIFDLGVEILILILEN